ncbi:helix-turn-helix domain-containing protein [Amycolatopsis albispora]|uniref:Uncharacterized protein n=1 Tax=Amycolatopsis albispora TaxID=1804986 RepID=A0A344KZN5_9PSEU|nr:helix-turn-helix domain-containing protein [Amycolatopsis albispora]AXB41259.1 hypothetical protein A4R43_00955 [Amycolatopsis albispora]
MPGGRLTYEERRRIAAWLADGLGYAEIGRRLDRPTSTISREVARNSAAGDYRAAQAQQNAGHRARRRRPAPPRGSSGDEQPAVREFQERFAALLAATGLPRMTARVFACLITAGPAGWAAADLVRQLEVSPASVSKAIGALEGMEIVTRRHEPGTRRERYLITDDAWLRAWRSDTGTHREIADAARQGAAIVGPRTAAGARLATMGEFFAQLSAQMDTREAGEDALTVMAALAHAGRPLTRTALATALGWPGRRVATALTTLRRQPAIADPLTLNTAAPGKYTLIAREDRLTATQRAALAR